MKHWTPKPGTRNALGLLTLLLLVGCATPPPGQDPASTRDPNPTYGQSDRRQGYYVAIGDGVSLPARIFIYSGSEAAR